MSVTLCCSDGFIISHELFINNLYKETEIKDDSISSLSFDEDFFSIVRPFAERKESILSDEALAVKSSFETIIKLGKVNFSLVSSETNNVRARTRVDMFLNETNSDVACGTSGGNNSCKNVVCKLNGEQFVVPMKCMFYCHDVVNIKEYISERFDFILMDPPWWNKSIRKKRKWNSKSGYDMMYNKDIVDIPVKELLTDNGLVGVWCTNADSHIADIKESMFKQWGLKYCGDWYWVKVTKLGEPICAFSKLAGKQPFERILFGARERVLPTPENRKVIVSVPSAIHSHKPPLTEVLAPYLPNQPKCLEVFARYLLPHWTSYGKQVLKLQHLSLYKNKPQTS